MRSARNVFFLQMTPLVSHLDFNKTGISRSVNEEDAILVLVIMMESRVRREKNNPTNIAIILNNFYFKLRDIL